MPEDDTTESIPLYDADAPLDEDVSVPQEPVVAPQEADDTEIAEGSVPPTEHVVEETPPEQIEAEPVVTGPVNVKLAEGVADGVDGPINVSVSGVEVAFESATATVEVEYEDAQVLTGHSSIEAAD